MYVIKKLIILIIMASAVKQRSAADLKYASFNYANSYSKMYANESILKTNNK